MLCKVISVVLLFLNVASSAAVDCEGSALNVDGFVPRPQDNKAGFGEFPWTVALYKKDAEKPHCAGSIIDASTILTTAFCIKKIENPSDLIIRAGMWDLNRTSVEDYQMQQRVATDIKAHPKHSSPDPIENDIAVIHVNQPFNFNQHIQKICLDDGSKKVSTKSCFASGWGSESYETQDELSQYLKKVQMDQVDRDICQKQLRIALKKDTYKLSENFFCAGGNKNDLCIGDNGDPFVCPISGEANKYVLSGLSSHGVKCFTETPGVYTNVAKYVDWIREQSALVSSKDLIVQA